ncbi:hypothetical protein [Providencia manganoxydans]|uniref:hypothetical protein n=1 Tax=Providencia manganoxydans TaxID=2923283 RepID=UPI0034E412D3
MTTFFYVEADANYQDNLTLDVFRFIVESDSKNNAGIKVIIYLNQHNFNHVDILCCRIATEDDIYRYRQQHAILAH